MQTRKKNSKKETLENSLEKDYFLVSLSSAYLNT
jgi:hypothetical protein